MAPETNCNIQCMLLSLSIVKSYTTIYVVLGGSVYIRAHPVKSYRQSATEKMSIVSGVGS